MTLPIDTIFPSEELPDEAAAASLPDRADAPVSEVTERFLKMVLAHVPLDRIEELHLFSPLRQGGVETGIAVIAARVPVIVPAEESTPELPFEADADDAVIVEELPVDELPVDELPVDELPVDELPVDDVIVEDAVDDDVLDEVGLNDEIIVDEVTVAEQDAIDDDIIVIDEAPAPRVRHTVYTARYRLVQKGPERGKWEADVVAEADAPLITVDLVVRGVQRRAGEESEIVRYSGSQLARALRIPQPTL